MKDSGMVDWRDNGISGWTDNTKLTMYINQAEDETYVEEDGGNGGQWSWWVSGMAG